MKLKYIIDMVEKTENNLCLYLFTNENQTSNFGLSIPKNCLLKPFSPTAGEEVELDEGNQKERTVFYKGDAVAKISN